MADVQDALGKLAAAVALMGTAGVVRGQSSLDYYVDSRAPAGGNGHSWASAFNDLQHALDAYIADRASSRQILVAGGTYKPDHGTGDRLRSFSFVASGVTLYLIGSFAGRGAADPFVRSIEEHPTILSGDLAGNDGPAFENTTDNSRLVLYVNGGEQQSRFEMGGFIVEGGVGLPNESACGGLIAENTWLGWVTGCTFRHNRGSLGGALRMDDVFVYGCTFDSNTAFGSGGALSGNDLSIAFCSFLSNSAGGFGGAVKAGSVQFNWSTLRNNSALAGGAVFSELGAVSIRGSVLARNHAEIRGGALDAAYTNSSIVCCTLADNSAPIAPGIWSAGQLLLRNTIVDSGSQPPIDGGAASSIAYSLIRGGWPGVGNVDADPRFADRAAGDYHLAGHSPAIDAGTNDNYDPYQDLEKNPRPVDDPGTPDTGLGLAPIVDIGAYEFQGTTCYADCDASGSLNILDFNCFLNTFTSGSPRANCDNSSTPPTLNVLDFTCFINRYTAGCP